MPNNMEKKQYQLGDIVQMKSPIRAELTKWRLSAWEWIFGLNA
ncbi:hypothetical protein P7H25_16410 [Paenibacillus larvae]|nr:hypothetical protein [Paenibacillus larvae]